MTDDPAVARPPDRPHGDPLGELLPDGTVEEADPVWGEEHDDRDESLRREIPPHHH
ncbi:MAG: hypothetical protein M3P83_12080 [Actinomycetota bacterium]|nr:hypothetical protein [Actinomycetota bacterium]